MSRNPKDKPIEAPKTPRFNDVKFINWSLNDEEKAACKAWVLTVEDFDNALTSLLQSGYKITQSFDENRSVYTGSIIPTQNAKSNQGFILAGKGSTPLKAIKQALYIHFHIMGEEWASYSLAGSTEQMDD